MNARDEFVGAVSLNFLDLRQSRYYLTALVAIEASGEFEQANSPSFYALAYEAMLRSTELICMRTLDPRTVRGFEWILKQCPDIIAGLDADEMTNLDRLRNTAKQLQTPRDKAVAHIDKVATTNMKVVYGHAPAWSEIRAAIETALALLARIWSAHVSATNLLSECALPYDGSDGVTLLRYANRNNLHWHQKSENPEWFDQIFVQSMPHSG